jgi:hypothetical protein
LDRTVRRTVFYHIYGLKPYKYGCTPYFRTIRYTVHRSGTSLVQMCLGSVYKGLQGVTKGYKDGLQPETLVDGNWLLKQNQPVSKIETKSDTNLKSLDSECIDLKISDTLMTSQERNQFRAQRSKRKCVQVATMHL